MPILKLNEKSLAAIAAPIDAAQAYYWDTEIRGFGVVVGRTGRRTFLVRGRLNGRLKKEAFGVAGQPSPNGQPWTVILARIEARTRLGAMSGGRSVSAERVRATGPTLRRGLELHIANMRKRNCSERSIETIEAEVPRLLAKWLDRPIAEFTGAELDALHGKLTTTDDKPYLANRIVAQVSAIWNALDRVHELAGRNPARAVTRNKYTPRRERVADGAMADWYEKVQKLTGVRRDLQMFVLFTGMRSEAARHVRWEHIDEDLGALVVPKPKGGEAKAFTLPLAPSVLKMLIERRDANAIDMKIHGGDHGWVFPSLSRGAPFVVQPLAEPKEYRQVGGRKGVKVAHLPGPHVLRRTYLSVATEAGVSELDRHVLANHAYGRQSVNATYIEQAFDHLAACQAKIEAALWSRLKPDPKAKPGRAKLRAV